MRDKGDIDDQKVACLVFGVFAGVDRAPKASLEFFRSSLLGFISLI